MKYNSIFSKLVSLCILAFLFLSFGINAHAYVSVKGYYRSNGTYVAPYVRSNPNGLKYDNYSYKPSQGLYNSSYGTKGVIWDTPTYITDPDYYVGKALYESKSSASSANTVLTPTTSPSYAYADSASSFYCNTGYKVVYNSSFEKIGCQQIIVPANALIIGSDWYCKAGHKTIYSNSFQKLGCE